MEGEGLGQILTEEEGLRRLIAAAAPASAVMSAQDMDSLPGIASVRAAACCQDAALARWLTIPLEVLGGQTPADALRQGQVSEVAAAAEFSLHP